SDATRPCRFACPRRDAGPQPRSASQDGYGPEGLAHGVLLRALDVAEDHPSGRGGAHRALEILPLVRGAAGYRGALRLESRPTRGAHPCRRTRPRRNPRTAPRPAGRTTRAAEVKRHPMLYLLRPGLTRA